MSVDDAVGFESSDLMFLNACNLGEAFVRGSRNCRLGQGWVKTHGFPLSFEKENKNDSNISNLVKKVYCTKRVIALYISSLPSPSLSSLPTHPRIPSPVLEVLYPAWGLRSLEQRMMTLTLNRSRWEWLLASAAAFPPRPKLCSSVSKLQVLHDLFLLSSSLWWIKN